MILSAVLYIVSGLFAIFSLFTLKYDFFPIPELFLSVTQDFGGFLGAFSHLFIVGVVTDFIVQLITVLIVMLFLWAIHKFVKFIIPG